MALANKFTKAQLLFWNWSNVDTSSINYAFSLVFKGDCLLL